jgi:Cdc6-like AAA superfamily ATPase
MKENSESQQRDETLQWICPFDQAARQAKLLCIGRDGPGKWFLECEEFLLWISNENIKTLFCTGVPGASKTVLSSIAVDHLQEKFSNDDDVAVVYFYFDFQQPFDFTTLISSLLRQLLQASPGLHGTILGLNISRRYSRGPLPEDRVKEELRRVISQLSKVFFVVDALEECVDVRVRRQFFSG